MRNLQKTQFQIFWAQFQGLILRIDWARRSWEKLGSYRKVNSSLHGSKQKSVNASIWVETIFWSKQTNRFKTTDRVFKAWYSKLIELQKARSLPESQLVAAGLELEIGSREYLIGKSILILANKWFQNDPSYFQSLIFRVDRAAKSPALTGKSTRCCRPRTRNRLTRIYEWKEHFDLGKQVISKRSIVFSKPNIQSWPSCKKPGPYRKVNSLLQAYNSKSVDASIWVERAFWS